MTARGGSRWTEADYERAAEAMANMDGARGNAAQPGHRDAARAALDAVFPVGEPDEQKTINGLLDAVKRLNGQKDALRRENGQLRELLDLPVGERVEAVAELVGEPDDARLVKKVAELMRRQEGEHRGVQWNLPVYRKRARAVVAAVRAASKETE